MGKYVGGIEITWREARLKFHFDKRGKSEMRRGREGDRGEKKKNSGSLSNRYPLESF